MKAITEVVRNSPGLSFSFRERSEPLCFSWHRHREYELTYVCTGSGRRYVGNDVSSFSVGDLVLIGANLPHAYESFEGERCRFVIVQFPRELFASGHLRLREFRAIHSLLAHAAGGLCFDAVTSRLVRPLLLPASGHEDLDKLIDLMRILDLLARRGRWRGISPEWRGREMADPPPPSRRPEADVMQYLFEHSTGRLSLAEVAGIAGTSVATLCRSFRRDLGCTVNEYLTRIRISQACTLLIQTSLPVYSISYQVGFENLSNFNRRFLRLKGMTPTAYRRIHGGIAVPAPALTAVPSGS